MALDNMTSNRLPSPIDTLATGQIVFPATQNASAGANTLDDYEEGTWTPVVGGSATYTTQSGTYTKIGRLVFVRCTLVINAIGTGSTTVISNLPFTNAAAFNVAGSTGAWSGAASSFVTVLTYVTASASTLTVFGTTAAGASSGATAVFASGSAIVCSAVYETT